MKILITGSRGLLGSTVLEYLKYQSETVRSLDRDEFSWHEHRTNIEQLIGFDCVIHAAANTNVEACEADHASCYRDNTLLTERLAYAARQARCKFVYVSSTGIYGTEKAFDPYHEYDRVNPTTHHHRAKWLGEKAVNKYSKNALILRTGWLFGGKADSLKNFVTQRIDEAVNNEAKQIRSNNQQRGAPTFARDFAARLYELIKKDEVGTYNLVNEGAASRYDYVSKIIEIAGLDVAVIPTSADTFNRKAMVSSNETAISVKLGQLGYRALPSWQESLETYIKSDLKTWLGEKKK